MTGSNWIKTHVVSGHGVASGRSASSPYPAGTIAMQRPIFKSLGLDLDACWPGTLNLSIAPLELQLKQPDHCFELVHWTDHHPPETFSFWRIELKPPSGESVAAWLYYPHPETKARHWQPATVMEVLAPRLDHISPGSEIAIRDGCNRLHCVDGVRLRARLLEFLKFRVLAAQSDFFESTATAEDRSQWLADHWPEALDLDHRSIGLVWEQAKRLYTEL